MSNVVDLLKAMVRFKSLSGQEAEICSFIESVARDAGLPTLRLENSVCFHLGEGPRRLLLNSHLDVVPAAGDDAFEPVEKDGLLYGRGTADAKASGGAMATAVLTLAAEGWMPPDGQVLVALTQCEETNMARNGMRALREVIPKPDAALVGEPTQLVPVIAQKGLLILRLESLGRSAHAARAALGDNAIYKAARDIERIQHMAFGRADEWLGHPTVNVTTIEGGSARNVIPDQCTFYVDIRSTPSYTHDEIVQRVRDLVESEVTVHSDRIIPVATSQNECIVQACLAALPGASPQGSPTASDWIHLADVPTVKIGPGASEASHTPDEHVRISEVVRAVDVYRRIIKSFYREGCC